MKPNLAGWGNKQFLSGEKWLHLSIDADKVDKELPAEGALSRYDFAIKSQKDHEVWARIGFEFARSPFDVAAGRRGLGNDQPRRLDL